MCAVGRHRGYEEHRFHPCPRPGASVGEVGAAVVVPQRATVDKALCLLDEDGLLPRSAHVAGFRHEQSLVGVAPVDVEPAVVVAYRRSPHVVAVLRAAVPVEVGATVLLEDGIVVGERRTDYLPVDEVGGVQDLQPGEAGERRCRHIVVVAHAAHVGIAVVGIDDRIAVFSSRNIRIPCFRRFLRRGRNREREGRQEDDVS